THIRTQTGWLCLAAVMASHSRKTIGRAMDATMPTEPVCRALRMGNVNRKRRPSCILAGVAGNLLGLASSFNQLGLSPSMMQRFVPIVLQYVQGSGGAGTSQLLQSALMGGM
ncbi:MAG: hypothetical protein HOO87_10240, partial [Methyloglobulus sp.]|nr:hypothetical protein [Methyloglobulus sp.]